MILSNEKTRKMLTKRNRPPAPAPPRPPPAAASVKEPLPMDMLLEIVARCDVTTIIRCTGASKFLRAAIIDQAFRRRLQLQAAGGGDTFDDPALLFSVSYVSYGSELLRTYNIVPTPSSIQLHAKAALLQGASSSLQYTFEPVASRGPLLLLRRFRASPDPPNVELQVCDTTTGKVTTLPNVSTFHAHAILSVGDSDDAGASYELMVTDMYFRFQTLSSKHGQWDAVREATVSGYCPRRMDTSSRVVGRTVYWLCELNSGGGCWGGIVALDVDAAEAPTMELPPGCLSRIMSPKRDKHLLLASPRGCLSLLVAEGGGISMWTLTPALAPRTTATWSRQLVIGAEEIVRPVGLVSFPLSYVLEGFGERSGAVIVRVDRMNLLRIDMATKVVTKLRHLGDASIACLFLHETDRVSLLNKSF